MPHLKKNQQTLTSRVTMVRILSRTNPAPAASRVQNLLLWLHLGAGGSVRATWQLSQGNSAAQAAPESAVTPSLRFGFAGLGSLLPGRLPAPCQTSPIRQTEHPAKTANFIVETAI